MISIHVFNIFINSKFYLIFYIKHMFIYFYLFKFIIYLHRYKIPYIVFVNCVTINIY